MKNNLENAFKESLQDYEVPYNPKAWEAVSAKLDAQATAGGKGSSRIWKWTAAFALIGTLVIGTYYMFTNKGTQTVSNKTNSEISNDKITENTDRTSVGTSGNEDLNSQNSQVGDAQVVEENGAENSNSNPENQLVPIRIKDSKSSDDTPQSGVNRKSDNLKSNTDDGNKNFTPSWLDSKTAQYIEGRISMLNVCEGESIVISNPDVDKKLVKFQEHGGQVIVLDPGKSFVFEPKSSTNISFIDGEGNRMVTKQINVHSLPEVNFTYEANIFEEGLPVVVCEAFGEYASYNWTFDGKIARDGEKTTHNFFKDGDHSVALKVTDRNGCENTMEKIVQIRDNYNLMAVGGFIPNSADPRTRTFMPYALTERDVKFQLTIIDPTDNGVVFTSKDAKNAWDGTDQRTGKMTLSNKTFIWKVQINNPVPNERPIYSGTIVHD